MEVRGAVVGGGALDVGLGTGACSRCVPAQGRHIAAYNTMQSLARAIVTNTSYARADDEAHTLIRTALAGSGDIIPEHATNTLHIRLDPLPARRHTAAIDELCQVLNDTHTVYPATTLTLRYSIKSHR